MREEHSQLASRQPRSLPPVLAIGGMFATAAAAIAAIAWLLSLQPMAPFPVVARPETVLSTSSQPLALLVAGLGGWLMSRLLVRWPRGWTVRALAGVLLVAGSDAAFVAVNHSSTEKARHQVALGEGEGCMSCHAGMTGFSAYHQPENIGCASCHAGNPRTLDAREAHADMVRVPGNLADVPRTCGTANCHAAIVPRIERSIMNTFAGVIATDRRAFGETGASGSPSHVRDLGSSAADSHLRQLCASCHLGQTKSEWGPITQESRGGGCNACHLNYSPEALRGLANYRAIPAAARRQIPTRHPSLTINVSDDHCFGCHSRSSRIATSYEGWHELRAPPAPAELAANGARYQLLDDGRYLIRVTPDVHREKGLGCTDCHTATEVMGAGTIAAHKSDQTVVRCEDCHATRLASLPASAADVETVKLAALRGQPLAADARIGRTRTGDPLVSVRIDAAGQGALRRKDTGESLPLKPPAPACTAGAGHARLSCGSCHTAWAPRCASCHTRFDPATPGFDHLQQMDTQGAWTESSGFFDAAAPTLGVRLDLRDSTRSQGTIDTFVPGMVLTLDRNRQPDRTADTVFHRWYAPIAPHTIRREARSCASCHNDPVALGYGRGALRYETALGIGHWRFTPESPPTSADGLPADAWIGFLQTRNNDVAANSDVRPFTTAEQQRVLRVGACLTCHDGDSPVMRQTLADFDAVLARRRAACIPPSWP